MNYFISMVTTILILLMVYAVTNIVETDDIIKRIDKLEQSFNTLEQGKK